MVRQFNQKYYFIHENGYYVEMDPDHVESLEEAFTYHPEMAMCIHGHSQLWQDVGPHPPVWDDGSQQWLISRVEPARGSCVAWEIDLDDYKPAKGWWWDYSDWGDWRDQAWKGSWDDWQDWGTKAWKGCDKPKWSEDRYATRGYSSATRRHQKRALEREGMPVPDHLKPVKAQYCQEVKREMKKLWLAMRQAAQASSEDEMPSYKPAKAKDEEEDKDSRRSPSVSSSYSSEPARGSRAHRSPSPAKGLKREWRERSCERSERRERSSSSSTHPARVWRGTPSRPKEAGTLLPVTEEEEKPEKALVKTKTEKTQEPEKATKTEDTEEPEKADEEEKKRRKNKKSEGGQGGVPDDQKESPPDGGSAPAATPTA